MTKLSLIQIDEANSLAIDELEWEEVGELLPCDHEVDETVYRNTYQRKELRSQRQRDEGEVIGKGGVRKHRKF